MRINNICCLFGCWLTLKMLKKFLSILLVLTSFSINAQKTKLYLSLADALKQPEQVYKLSLVGKNLKEVPVSIIKFKNLEFLDLRENQLTEIPKNICKLKNLTELRLNDNKIKELPKSIGRLTKLETLNLSKNE
jgi:Leucine-rich repeat (LRR) protein